MNVRARLRQLLADPPRVRGVMRTPAGWLARHRGRLHPVLAWTVDERDQVAGLIAGGRGVRSVAGRRFLASDAASAELVGPPALRLETRDLEEAIDCEANPWTAEAQARILARLQGAARLEWAAAAVAAFIGDPHRFLRLHFEVIAEHGWPAELNAGEREWLANLRITEER